MDPKFQETSRLANLANFEVEHLTRQLELIESGEDWYELTGYDQQGQPQYVKHDARTDGKIDNAAKARVMSVLTQTQNATQIAQQRLQGIQQQYRQNAAQATQELRAIEAKLMPNVVPEKFTPEEKEWFEFAGTQSPTRFKGHPLVHTHQLMFVAYMRLLNAAKGLEERATKAEKLLEREALRYLLKKAGFVCLKNSVWISPFPFEHFFSNIKKDLGLTNELLIVVTQSLDEDSEKFFIESFNL
jgi:hypothetical protein